MDDKKISVRMYGVARGAPDMNSGRLQNSPEWVRVPAATREGAGAGRGAPAQDSVLTNEDRLEISNLLAGR